MSNELVDFNPESLYDEQPTRSEAPAASVAETEDDFGQMIAEGTRQEFRSVDSNKPRYGVAILSPIALNKASAAFYMGDFNIKHEDRSKGNRINIAFFPRLKLMPFTSKEYPIPYEGTATLMTEEEAEEEMEMEPETFDVASVESTLRSSRRKRRISAEKWSLQMYDRFKTEGFTILEAVTGIESYTEAERIFEAVITEEKVLKAVPHGARERLGFSLDAPFVPEIVTYLERFARDNMRDAARDTEEFAKMEKIRISLLAGARQARKHCEKTLSDTEAQIARKEKKGYDLPDYLRQNAKPPKDLVAMIHLNKFPKDMEALMIAERTGAAVAAAASPAPGNQNYVPASADSVPRSEVEKMLDKQRREFEDSLTALRNEFSAAAGSKTEPEATGKPIGKLPVRTTAAKAEESKK
jgi:hypothetical protein